MERSFVWRKTCGTNYPGSQTWHKSGDCFIEQNKQWTNEICTDLTLVKFAWSGDNLYKLPFGKPGPRWENNIKTNRI